MTFTKKYLNHFIRHPLCIVILFSLIARAEPSSFTPSPRYSASSTLIGARLYFFGGQAKDSDGTENCQNSVFYLDLSTSFDTNDTPWTDLTATAGIPERICWQVNGGGGNGSTVYLFGGITQNNLIKKVTSDTLVFAFDTNTGQWTKPSITGTPPERRKELSVAQDDSGKVFIFGGLHDSLTRPRSTTWFNDMTILDISKLSWLDVLTYGIDIPPPQADFTATMLPNGTILYIGGRQSNSASGTNITYKSMDQIWTYNTKRGYWNLITASGTIPGARVGHSAVLASNGRIIVYGGKSDDSLTPSSPDLVVLDTSSLQWSTPNVSGTSPPVLAYHSATLIENLMIVAFGNKTQTTSPGASSDIYILDTDSYAWMTTFKLSPTATSSDVAQSSNPPNTTQSGTPKITYNKFMPINTALILGVCIGGVVSIFTICVLSFFLFRQWRKYKKLYGDKIPFSEPISPPPDLQMPGLHQGFEFGPTTNRRQVLNF